MTDRKHPPEDSTQLPTAPLPEQIQDAFETIMSAPAETQARSVAELCDAHPSHAEALRGQFETELTMARMSSSGTDKPHDSSDPERIGKYRVLERIGEGGMGRVYRALQESPIEQEVAIKLLKRGLDTEDILQRFRVESDALARMSHPSIARVFDGGATDDGRPYFVMELIHGVPIDRYCNENALSVAERIALFRQVCEGVQHAHEKGILHRDLKPSNVLVETSGGQALPKLIDFGLARAIQPAGVDRTLPYDFGQDFGTPGYMSPEQAGDDSSLVDTRSDVYSLGILLYKLLTGTLPFDESTLRRKSWEAIEKLLHSTPPPAPSSRWTRSGEDGDALARVLGRDRASLKKQVQGDLDAITLKSISPDREQRYAMPSELAHDLRKFELGDPVSARTPSSGYLLRKFLGRHRTATVSAALIFIALILGLGLTLWQYEHAKENEEIAEVALRDYQEFADARVARDLVVEADTKLWPAEPQQLEAIETWWKQTNALLSRLATHRKRLQQLKAEPRIARPELGASRQSLDERIAVLQELLDTVNSWQEKGGLIERMQWRRHEARTIRQRSIEQHRELWKRTIEEIAQSNGTTAHRRYRRLRITPQLGLVPIGMDPESKLHEFAHLQSGEVPSRDPKTGKLRIQEASEIVLVLIPGGRAIIGAQRANPNGPNYYRHCKSYENDKDWLPVRVRLDPYFISKYEMTQAQWLRFNGENPSGFNPDRKSKTWDFLNHITLMHPIENVTWTEADETMRRVSLELPTEAQWEFAARCFQSSPWSHGWDPAQLGAYANIADRYMHENGGAYFEYTKEVYDGFSVTAPIGSFRANPFGLHDMYGNVTEYARDFWGSYDEPMRDGDGLRGVPTFYGHVVRGGSWHHPAESCRSSNRYQFSTRMGNGETGVRPMRPLRGAWHRD